MSAAVKWAFILAAVAAALVGVDRLMLAAERRGWVYWRKRKASPGSMAGAMLEIHSLLQPSARYVGEEQRRVTHKDDGQGDPPGPATGKPLYSIHRCEETNTLSTGGAQVRWRLPAR